MKTILLLGLVLLTTVGCTATRTPVPKPTETPSSISENTPEPTNVVKPTRTPWPTLIAPMTLAPEPTAAPGATSIAPVWSPTPRITLPIICSAGGSRSGLVLISNFIGQPGHYADVQIGGLRCSVAPNSAGYAQLDPGTYSWSASIPVKGRWGRVQGSVTVSPGPNSSGIVLCMTEDHLATVPQCPSGGAALPGSASAPEPSLPTATSVPK